MSSHDLMRSECEGRMTRLEACLAEHQRRIGELESLVREIHDLLSTRLPAWATLIIAGMAAVIGFLTNALIRVWF